MRIDRGPSLAELRLSADCGTVVEFRNVNGQGVRGRVLDGRLDPGIGRVNLVLEEDRTGIIWFARYRWGSVRCASGDISVASRRPCRAAICPLRVRRHLHVESEEP